jgi:hypothetical protein
VIRRLTDVLGKKSVASNKRIEKTSQLLSNIVNHKENKADYFFLHPAPQVGIGDDWVVDLRTVFSLVSRFHYPSIRRSRMVSLNEVFANRLGWMMGNMYARIPTPTWNEIRPERKQSDSDYLKRLLQKIAQSAHDDPYPFEKPFGSSDSK